MPYARHFPPAEAFTTKAKKIRKSITAGVLNDKVLITTLNKQLSNQLLKMLSGFTRNLLEQCPNSASKYRNIYPQKQIFL